MADVTSPESMAGDVLRKQADWAARFEGGTVNPALKARHAADQARYSDYLAGQREAAQQDLLMRDKNALNAHIRLQQLDTEEKTAQMKMENAQRLQPLIEQAKIAQTAATNALEQQRIQTATLAAKKATLEAADTVGFTQHMSELLDRSKPGEDDYKLGILKGVEAFPHADKALVKQYAAPALETDPSLTTALSNIPPGFKATQVHRGVNGQWGFSAKPVSDSPGLTGVDLGRERSFWQKERDTYARIVAGNGTAEEKQAAQLRVNHAQSRIDAVMTPAATAPATAAPDATAPATTVAATEPVKISSADEFHALPSGAIFFDPNGVKRAKP